MYVSTKSIEKALVLGLNYALAYFRLGYKQLTTVNAIFKKSKNWLMVERIGFC